MKIRSLAIAVSTVLLAAVAWAADLTGTWKGQISGPNGDFALTYTLKQDGSKLTGTVTGPQGDPLDLIDGKVEAGKVHFAVNVPMNGGMKFVSEGTIKGDDEITIETKNDAGEPLGGPMTLKRQK